ncbi:peptide chain release factor N(5)-glutamine methyltransferase [Candidatus Saccharibacteria bacterium]|nr:peptide chain release factor N(5)-glutamine methyltransferase [Candidatus Saccharibacteria bacterium]
MTIQEFLKRAVSTLDQAGIATARLDVLILLEDELGRNRAQLLAHSEDEIPPGTEVILDTKIAQRANHTPLAYVRGKVEFYDREFVINEHVLVPRPETETMIDELKAALQMTPYAQLTIIDVGTGSGAIAITAKLEFPDAKVIATDIDPDALRVARQNAKKYAVSVEFLQGNLLRPIIDANLFESPSIVLANLPYVPDHYSINQAADHEPKHAIFGGKDGLDLYRKLWEQIANLSGKPFLVVTESLPTQHTDMLALAQRANYKLYSSQDFMQVFKPTAG